MASTSRLRHWKWLVPISLIAGGAIELTMIKSGYYEYVRKHEAKARAEKMEQERIYWENRRKREEEQRAAAASSGQGVGGNASSDPKKLQQ